MAEERRWSATQGGPGSVRSNRPLVIDPSQPEAVEWTVEALRAGSVAVIPTDTVYGVAATLGHPQALDRLFAIKGRPTAKPLPVMLSSPAHLGAVSAEGGCRLMEFAAAFWPGALTIVLAALPGLPIQVVGRDGSGQPTVGVRIPAHALAIEIVEGCGGALAVTSANRSGGRPARTAAEAVAALGPAVDLVVDGGECRGGVASSVVSFEGSRLRVIREGAIGRVALEAAWDAVGRGR